MESLLITSSIIYNFIRHKDRKYKKRKR